LVYVYKITTNNNKTRALDYIDRMNATSRSTRE